MGAAYQVAQLLGQRLAPLRAFYLATLAGARMLRLEDRIGHFSPGTEADFIVLDPAATPLLARRMAQARTLSERLLLWMVLGDDRAIAATYILGEARAAEKVQRAGESKPTDPLNCLGRAPKTPPMGGEEPP
jgi:guanine deaminase